MTDTPTYFYEYIKLDSSYGIGVIDEDKYHFLMTTGLYTLKEEGNTKTAIIRRNFGECKYCDENIEWCSYCNKN